MGIVGATLSLLDALYLSIHLPSDITVKYIGFGSPRVRFDQLLYKNRCSTFYAFHRSVIRHSLTSSTRCYRTAFLVSITSAYKKSSDRGWTDMLENT